MVALSNKFYRLVKPIDKKSDGSVVYAIYDFHQVTNGFMHYQYHEAVIDDTTGEKKDGYHGKDIRLGYGQKAIDDGNKMYRTFKGQGYKLYGIYEQDIYGVEKLVERK